MAQINATVGDLSGNADKIVEWTRRAGRQGAHLVVFPEMTLTGYPVEDLVLRGVVRRGVPARRCERLAARLAGEGLGELAVVVGYLDRRTDGVAPRSASPPARRWTPPRCCTAAEVVVALRPSTTCPTTASSTSTATSCRATRCRWSGCTASTSRSPSARTCGRTAARSRSTRRGGRRLLVVHERLAVRAGQGRRRREDLCAGAPGRRARALAYVQPWSAARTSWSSTATRSSSTRTANLLARGPQFDEALLVTDLELPAAPAGLRPTASAVDAGDGTTITIERTLLVAGEPRSPATSPSRCPVPSRSTTSREVYSGAGARGARLRAARTASAP